MQNLVFLGHLHDLSTNQLPELPLHLFLLCGTQVHRFQQHTIYITGTTVHDERKIPTPALNLTKIHVLVDLFEHFDFGVIRVSGGLLEEEVDYHVPWMTVVLGDMLDGEEAGIKIGINLGVEMACWPPWLALVLPNINSEAWFKN